MSDKLKSRKLLFSIATTVSIFLSEAFGYDLSPEAIFGIVAATASYVGIEGIIDRGAAKAAVESSIMDAYQQLQMQSQTMYARLQELGEFQDPGH